MSILSKRQIYRRLIGRATAFTTRDTETLDAAKVGDIVRLDGRRYRVNKKTNYNAAVEPYTWANRVEDFVLDLAGKYLP